MLMAESYDFVLYTVRCLSLGFPFASNFFFFATFQKKKLLSIKGFLRPDLQAHLGRLPPPHDDASPGLIR